MSISTTITSSPIVTESQRITIYLYPFKERIYSLFENLKNLLPSKKQEKIKELEDWLTSFDFCSLHQDEAKEELSLFLGSLLYEVIQPALIYETDGHKIDHLLTCENSLRDVLIKVIPEGEDIDTFINHFEKDWDEITLLEEKMQQIEKNFQSHLNELVQSAHRIHYTLIHRFSLLKECLIQMNEIRKSMTQEINRELDHLTSEVNTLSQILISKNTKIQEVSENMQREEQLFLKVIKDFEDIYQTIKNE